MRGLDHARTLFQPRGRWFEAGILVKPRYQSLSKYIDARDLEQSGIILCRVTHHQGPTCRSPCSCSEEDLFVDTLPPVAHLDFLLSNPVLSVPLFPLINALCCIVPSGCEAAGTPTAFHSFISSAKPAPRCLTWSVPIALPPFRPICLEL